jgi:threonine dehydrogenase-like Zn-dependent dehydrogenase
MAEQGKAEVLDFEGADVVEELKWRTGGRGPDACIDAVGMEAHVGADQLDSVYDRAKQTLMLATDRPHVLREAIQACREGGTVSVPGVYGGFLDKLPFGAVRQGADVEDGPDARAPLSRPAPRAHRARRHRSELRDHVPAPAGPSPGGLSDVSPEGRRLHQGRPSAVR